MAFYALSFDKQLGGTTQPAYAVTGAGWPSAGSSFRLVELYYGGRDSSSTPTGVAVNRPSAPGTLNPATVTTPAPMDNNSGNAGFLAYGQPTIAVSYSAAPTYGAVDLLNFGFNSYGGVVRWAALPGAEIVCVATSSSTGTNSGANLILGAAKAGATNPTLSGHFIIEQR